MQSATDQNTIMQLMTGSFTIAPMSSFTNASCIFLLVLFSTFKQIFITVISVKFCDWSTLHYLKKICFALTLNKSLIQYRIQVNNFFLNTLKIFFIVFCHLYFEEYVLDINVFSFYLL